MKDRILDDEAQETDRARLRAAAGQVNADLSALPARVRRALTVATRAGAPVLDVLDAAIAAQDDVRAGRRAVQVATAQARVVAVGLAVAPVVFVPFLARVSGIDLVAFYGTGVGRVVLVAGVSLLAAGAGAIMLMVRRVGRPSTSRRAVVPAATLAAVSSGLLLGTVAAVVAAAVTAVVVRRRRARQSVASGDDEVAELVATALHGGCTSASALRMAAEVLPGHAARLRSLAFDLDVRGEAMPADVSDPDTPQVVGRIGTVLRDAHRLGAPVAPALRRLGAQLRADEHARVLAAAERLPAQLTFPTALCLLPATLLLVGAPIVHAGLTATGG